MTDGYPIVRDAQAFVIFGLVWRVDSLFLEGFKSSLMRVSKLEGSVYVFMLA